MGRARKYATAAEKQKAYRERAANRNVTAPVAEVPREWVVEAQTATDCVQLVGGLTQLQAYMLATSLRSLVKRGTEVRSLQLGVPLILDL